MLFVGIECVTCLNYVSLWKHWILCYWIFDLKAVILIYKVKKIVESENWNVIFIYNILILNTKLCQQLKKTQEKVHIYKVWTDISFICSDAKILQCFEVCGPVEAVVSHVRTVLDVLTPKFNFCLTEDPDFWLCSTCFFSFLYGDS